MPVSAKPRSRWTIICDFDGTIAPSDVTDRLLERFAAAEWRQLESAWESRQISSYQCLLQQTELLSMTMTQLDEALEDISVDPAYVEFVEYAQAMGCDVRVASEGFGQVIRRLLHRAGVPSLPIAATHLIPNGRNRWMLGFPFARQECVSATCKCAVARERAGVTGLTLVIGDGRSDFCVATQAEFVFARGRLLDFCRTQALPHAQVTDFVEAKRQLMALLATEVSSGIGLTARQWEKQYG